MESNTVLRLDIIVPSDPYDQLCSGALKVLQHFKKEWKPEEIKFKVFTDGITNRLIGCFLQDRPHEMILIRVYGKKTELFIDRRAEVANMQLMHKAGLGSPVFCGFQNGLCYGYSPGTVFDEKLVRDPLISRLVAEEMARMHNVKPDESDLAYMNWEPCLFTLLHKYIGLVPSSLPCPDKNKRLKKHFPSKAEFHEEIVCLEAHLTNLGSPTVFCHNDLLLKNIIYDKETDKVTFIDFEYAASNYQAFDIGNHFCEFAGVETFAPELYPDQKFQFQWLKNYLQAKSDAPVSKMDIEVLYVQVNKFALASHLMWGLWALIQFAHSTLDFDFLGYAIQRIGEYFKRKEEFLSMKMPEDTYKNGVNGL